MSDLAGFQAQFAAALVGRNDAFELGKHQVFRVYLNTTTKALADALMANFPTVLALLGPDILLDLARQFSRAAPTQSPILAEYGAGFPEFLAGHGLSQEFPYLRDVARIDRFLTEAHLAADAPVLDAEAAARFAPEALLSAPLMLHPTLRFAMFDTPAPTIWLSHRGDAAPDCKGILILRHKDRVIGELADPSLCRFLSLIGDGACALDAAEHLLSEHPDADLTHDFARLIALGAFQLPLHIDRTRS